MKVRKAYRIVEIKNGKIKTLFHGIKGSRCLKPGVWLKAERKLVSDGGTRYMSGFHVMTDWQECSDYLNRFKPNRELKVITVEVRSMRAKAHSPHNIYLAAWMRIPLQAKKKDFKYG
jgi:hypothetical protein